MTISKIKLKTTEKDKIMESVEIFEEQYRIKGLRAQRMYPNESLIRFLAKEGLLGSKCGVKCLEIGCGSGANLWMMAKEGLDVYGIDASLTSIELAKRHLADKWGVSADLRYGTFEQLPFENHTFEYVVDVVSLQHVDLKTAAKALREIHRVLKPKGKFFSYRLSDHSIMYNNSGNVYLDAATISNITEGLPLAGNGRTSFWSPALAREKYEEAGFSITQIDTVTRTYQSGKYHVEYLSIEAIKK